MEEYNSNTDEEKGTREKVDMSSFRAITRLEVKTYSSISCSASLLMSRCSIVSAGNKSNAVVTEEKVLVGRQQTATESTGNGLMGSDG